MFWARGRGGCVCIVLERRFGALAVASARKDLFHSVLINSISVVHDEMEACLTSHDSMDASQSASKSMRF